MAAPGRRTGRASTPSAAAGSSWPRPARSTPPPPRMRARPMATSAHAGMPSDRRDWAFPLSLAQAAACGVGCVALIVEAGVHVQQFFSLFHAVRWVGPLFLANAAACVVVAAALAFTRTRLLGALG